MELDPKYVGTRLRDCAATITERDTMNYAAAVGENRPVFFDDLSERGIIAPPMFGVAVTWQVSERILEFIDSADFPGAVFMTQVHYSEHLAFHKPVVPGSRLVIRGSLAAIAPHRAGTHVVIRYDVCDESGEPVFTEHAGGMLRGVVCRGEGTGIETLPRPYSFSMPEEPHWTRRIKTEPLLPFIYDGCARIHFPIHTSRKFAKAVGLPDIILQGTATLALAVREITDKEADGMPDRIEAISCRFADMVIPGSEITILATRREDDETGRHVSFIVVNQSGKNAISHGYVKIRL